MGTDGKSDPNRPVEPREIDGLLPLVLQIAEKGDMSEQEFFSAVVQALRHPDLENRLNSLLDAEGVSPELRREYLRMIAEWRRSLEQAAAAQEPTADSTPKTSAPQRKSSS